MRAARVSFSLSRMPSRSSSRPLAASITSTMMSASCAPPQAASTMARSRRRLGSNSPGVSMKTSWLSPSVAMPRTGARVVCTLCETIATLAPTRELTSVDLPALGAPITATKPQRRFASFSARHSWTAAPRTPSRSSSARAAACSAARLEAPFAAGRRLAHNAYLGGEVRCVIGAVALDLDVLRQRQPVALRPFLQRRFGIGLSRRLRLPGRARPEPAHAGARRGEASIDEDRAQKRLAWRRRGSCPWRGRRCPPRSPIGSDCAPMPSARATLAQVSPRTSRL